VVKSIGLEHPWASQDINDIQPHTSKPAHFRNINPLAPALQVRPTKSSKQVFSPAVAKSPEEGIFWSNTHSESDYYFSIATMRLLDLPTELIARISAFLEIGSPSDNAILDKPKTALRPLESDEGIRLMAIRRTSNRGYALKNFTLTNRFLRTVALPVLFNHAILDPLHLTKFIEFMQTQQLNASVSSIVAHMTGPYNHIHPAWWARLLNEVPCLRLTIYAAPEVFCELGVVPSWNSDSWAFDMPLQILRLNQSIESAHKKIDYDELPSFLVSKNWERMTFNEGSSISAYTGYGKCHSHEH
jgi:hypothetical protein